MRTRTGRFFSVVEEGSPKGVNLRTGSTAVRDEIEKQKRYVQGSNASDDIPNFGEQIYNPSFTFEATKTTDKNKKQMDLIVENEDKSSRSSIQGTDHH